MSPKKKFFRHHITKQNWSETIVQVSPWLRKLEVPENLCEASARSALRGNQLSTNIPSHWVRSVWNRMRGRCRKFHEFHSVRRHVGETIFQLTSCIPQWEVFENLCGETYGGWRAPATGKESCGELIFQWASCFTKVEVSQPTPPPTPPPDPPAPAGPMPKVP